MIRRGVCQRFSTFLFLDLSKSFSRFPRVSQRRAVAQIVDDFSVRMYEIGPHDGGSSKIHRCRKLAAKRRIWRCFPAFPAALVRPIFAVFKSVSATLAAQQIALPGHSSLD